MEREIFNEKWDIVVASTRPAHGRHKRSVVNNGKRGRRVGVLAKYNVAAVVVSYTGTKKGDQKRQVQSMYLTFVDMCRVSCCCHGGRFCCGFLS